MQVVIRAIAQLILAILIAGLVQAQATDDEVQVLSISSNKIDVLEKLTGTENHLDTITAYYAEIPETGRQELAELWQRMRRRTEDYQVAFRSGDTAEINETLDDLGVLWASIRTVHAREFTNAAAEVIESAYAGIFPFIQDSQ